MRILWIQKTADAITGSCCRKSFYFYSFSFFGFALLLFVVVFDFALIFTWLLC